MILAAATVCLAASTFSCEIRQIGIIDGDTVRIGAERIRLSGIDAPELDGACADESETALRSKERLATLIDGTTVTLDREGRDRYGRTLAAITVDGRDAGRILVEEGLARNWERRWRPGLEDYWCR